MRKILLATVLANGLACGADAQTVFGGNQSSAALLSGTSGVAGAGEALGSLNSAYGISRGAVRAFNEPGASQVHGYTESYGFGQGPSTGFSAGTDFTGFARQFGFGVAPGGAQ